MIKNKLAILAFVIPLTTFSLTSLAGDEAEANITQDNTDSERVLDIRFPVTQGDEQAPQEESDMEQPANPGFTVSDNDKTSEDSPSDEDSTNGNP